MAMAAAVCGLVEQGTADAVAGLEAMLPAGSAEPSEYSTGPSSTQTKSAGAAAGAQNSAEPSKYRSAGRTWSGGWRATVWDGVTGTLRQSGAFESEVAAAAEYDAMAIACTLNFPDEFQAGAQEDGVAPRRTAGGALRGVEPVVVGPRATARGTGSPPVAVPAAWYAIIWDPVQVRARRTPNTL
jgi:hypothetical protein